MLTSKVQDNASQRAANLLREMLDTKPDSELPEALVAANRRKLRRKLEAIEQQIEEYEVNISARVDELKVQSFEDLLKAPIWYRLAKGESVRKFAQKTGINERQILRYEQEAYENCTISSLKPILEYIGLSVGGVFIP